MKEVRTGREGRALGRFVVLRPKPKAGVADAREGNMGLVCWPVARMVPVAGTPTVGMLRTGMECAPIVR